MHQIVVNGFRGPNFYPRTVPTLRKASAQDAINAVHRDCSTAADQAYLLSTHPMVCWDESTSLQKARKKLHPRHKTYFDSSVTGSTASSPYANSLALFNKFASVLCETSVMPRKEVFETWSAAIYIHSHFFKQNYDTTTETSRHPVIRRFCDVAGGHGLLAWALLVLDDEERNEAMVSRQQHLGQETCAPLTALCVDRRMPSSAESIRIAMIRQWPHLEDRFDFVEGWLEQIHFHPTCLIASVHACGGLSDTIVASAIYNKAPVALVPCCHSRKKKALLGAPVEFAQEEYEEIMTSSNDRPLADLAHRLDEARETALRNAGFAVTTEFLPKIFTSKNRLIMASPTLVADPTTIAANTNLHHRGRMPRTPLIDTTKNKKDNSRTYHLEQFTIPCADSAAARTETKRLSGRLNANRRASARHRKKYAESPQFDISLWLPPASKLSSSQLQESDVNYEMKDAQDLTEEALSDLASSISPDVQCVAVKLGREFVHPSSGRRAQTFRLTYSANNSITDSDRKSDHNMDDASMLSDDDAKTIHEALYARVTESFPGTECR